MPRIKLTNKQWEQIEPLLPGRACDPGRTGDDNRKTLEGILWIVRTGAPWRDLPPDFGKWNTVYQRFRRWSKRGVFERLFTVTHGDLDIRSVQVDGSHIKVHQHGAGAPKAEARPQPPSGPRESEGAQAG